MGGGGQDEAEWGVQGGATFQLTASEVRMGGSHFQGGIQGVRADSIFPSS